jgi:hypothetical protein
MYRMKGVQGKTNGGEEERKKQDITSKGNRGFSSLSF